MNNQIKTFDWKTKHISNEDLSRKLFSAVSELFNFISNNEKKLSLLKVDSNTDYFGGRKWNLKTSQKEIFMDKRPNFANNQLYFDEKLRFDSCLRFIQLETNCHSTRDFWGCGLTKEYTLRFEIPGRYFQCVGETKSLIYINEWISVIPKKSRNKLVRLIYWYENSEKNYWDMNNLMRRLFERFKFSIVTGYSKIEDSRFCGFVPTYDITGNRNRKINKLLRGRKCN